MSDYTKLFVGGDISGIQKFIYNITSKRAAVSLKGRSEYLREYMDKVCAAVKQSAKEAGDTLKDNDVYCSGGKFYLITQNSEAIRNAIGRVAQEESRKIWDKHRGQLSLNIAYVPFDGDETKGPYSANGRTEEKCGILWDEINKLFAQQKNRKFQQLLTEDYDSFFEPQQVGAKPKICVLTGIESDDCILMPLEAESSESEEIKEVYMLPSAKEMIDRGVKSREKEKFKTFEEYADGDYLGVLRMDVDGLGARFIKGFESIDKYKEFSKQIQKFFEEDLKVEIKNDPNFSNHLMLVYAGGDDVFAVGRWDKTIEFAKHIHKETEKRFSKEGIHISGGVAIVKDKYPISRAAEMAGEAEEKAKSLKGKNAFTLFGKAIYWDDEFETVEEYKDKFASFLRKETISKGLLQKLMLYAEMSEESERKAKEEGSPRDYRFVWHMSYYLTRYAERYKESNREVYDFVCRIRDNQDVASGGRTLTLIAIAARWAELLFKKELTNNK